MRNCFSIRKKLFYMERKSFGIFAEVLYTIVFCIFGKVVISLMLVIKREDVLGQNLGVLIVLTGTLLAPFSLYLKIRHFWNYWYEKERSRFFPLSLIVQMIAFNVPLFLLGLYVTVASMPAIQLSDQWIRILTGAIVLSFTITCLVAERNKALRASKNENPAT